MDCKHTDVEVKLIGKNVCRLSIIARVFDALYDGGFLNDAFEFKDEALEDPKSYETEIDHALGVAMKFVKIV